jgi:hypothetical protein
LQDLVAQHFHSEVVGSRTVVGTTETHRTRVSYAQLQPLGIASLEARAEVVVQGGQIQSFMVTFTPEAWAQLQAAQRRLATPRTMPETGGPGGPADPWFLALGGLGIFGLGVAFRCRPLYDR